MDAAFKIDEAAWIELLDWHLASGTQGVVVAGTTGESPQLSEHEFASLLTLAVERAKGQMVVIAGTGSASTERTIAQTALAQSLGADAALVVTPYYVRPPQEGLYQHYMRIADAVALPLILYNVPTRTGVDLAVETTTRLSCHERIIGIKEALNDMARIQNLLQIKRERDFAVLSGDDDTATAAVGLGADGVISVVANVVPAQFAQLMTAARHLDAKGHQLLQELRPLIALMGVESNPIAVKWALHELGRCQPWLRLPLLALNTAHRPAMQRALRALGLLPTPLEA
jgi:4-hydroxy-tetrahydrodipicolinate synthase